MVSRINTGIASVLLVLLTGCATNLKTKNKYVWNIGKHSRLKLSRIRTSEHNGQLVLKGLVRKRHSVATLLPKKLQVEIINPDKTILAARQVGYEPGILTSNRDRAAEFTVKFHNIPPSGSTIRVAILDDDSK